MQVISTKLPEVKLISPQVYHDNRGFFVETFQCDRYAAQGIGPQFVQDNLSYSRKGILRGLHFQYPHAQGKLVSVLQGEVFDVAVDMRVGSPNFGQWVGEIISAENKHQLWIPEGFAHGFCVISDAALLAYKCTDFYHRETDINLRWDDPDLDIAWPIKNPELSDKDTHAPYLTEIEPTRLPQYHPKCS
jgi:dTDP-4-dehydrorhamnose 3,5-epimerase